MRLKKAAALLLAIVMSLACAPSAWAATANEEKMPDLIFYRSKVTDTFEGEIDIRSGKKGEVTDVQVKAGENPAFTICDYDDDFAYFDSLYRSVRQEMTVFRGGKEYEVTANLAVYDRVAITQATGSVTLTVKNNKTLQPVAGATYDLYQGNKVLEHDLESGSTGKITVKDLAPGIYELRPTSPAAGYKETSKPVPFTIGGIELAGGDYQVRTSAGKKITADDNEVLIAGDYTPDVELLASKEEQISTVTVTFYNSGASVDSAGKSQKKTFASAEEAQVAINKAKKNDEICGPIEITYALIGGSERSTCNYIQYVEKEVVAPTPTPTPTPTPVPTPPPNNGGGTNGGSNTNNQPTSTPKPSSSPATKDGKLTIIATTDSGQASGFLFDIIGLKADGATFNQSYKTDAAGEVTCTLPDGSYTVGLKENSSANQGVAIPEPQNVTITGGNATFLAFSLTVTERELVVTVVDDDGIPLEDVTVGIFDPMAEEAEPAEAQSTRATESNATDVSRELTLREKEAEEEKRKANPYDKKNALDTDTSDEEGIATFPAMPTTDLLAVVLEAPEGYAVTGEAVPISEGWDGEFKMLCQYVQVEISVTGEATGEPVLGATATLTDSDGQKVVSWEIERKSHRLIRVPAGQYGLLVAYGEEEDNFNLEVNNTDAEQTASLVSHLTGTVTVEVPDEKPGIDTQQIVLISLCVVVGVALIAVGIILWRKRRKRSGGYQ